MKNLTDERNKLVELSRGIYLRAGGDDYPNSVTIDEPTQGIVVESYTDGHNGEKMLVVLVNGHLVNVWADNTDGDLVGYSA